MSAAREQVAQELGAMLRLADLVTTTCGELAGRLRRLGGGDVRVVENYVESGFLRERAERGEGVVVGWVAGRRASRRPQGAAPQTHARAAARGAAARLGS